MEEVFMGAQSNFTIYKDAKNYCYVKDNASPNRIYFRCQHRSCPARVNVHKKRINYTKNHNHQANLLEVEIFRFRTNLRWRARISHHKKAKDLFDEVLAEVPEQYLAYFGDFNNYKQMIIAAKAAGKADPNIYEKYEQFFMLNKEIAASVEMATNYDTTSKRKYLQSNHHHVQQYLNKEIVDTSSNYEDTQMVEVSSRDVNMSPQTASLAEEYAKTVSDLFNDEDSENVELVNDDRQDERIEIRSAKREQNNVQFKAKIIDKTMCIVCGRFDKILKFVTYLKEKIRFIAGIDITNNNYPPMACGDCINNLQCCYIIKKRILAVNSLIGESMGANTTTRSPNKSPLLHRHHHNRSPPKRSHLRGKNDMRVRCEGCGFHLTGRCEALIASHASQCWGKRRQFIGAKSEDKAKTSNGVVYRCDDCESRFDDEATFERHDCSDRTNGENDVNNCVAETDEIFVCPLCEKIFDTMKEFQVHTQSHISNDDVDDDDDNDSKSSTVETAPKRRKISEQIGRETNQKDEEQPFFGFADE